MGTAHELWLRSENSNSFVTDNLTVVASKSSSNMDAWMVSPSPTTHTRAHSRTLGRDRSLFRCLSPILPRHTHTLIRISYAYPEFVVACGASTNSLVLVFQGMTLGLLLHRTPKS